VEEGVCDVPAMACSLSYTDLPMVMIDDIHFCDCVSLVALGHRRPGPQSNPTPVCEDSSESTRVVRSRLSDPRQSPQKLRPLSMATEEPSRTIVQVASCLIPTEVAKRGRSDHRSAALRVREFEAAKSGEFG